MEKSAGVRVLVNMNSHQCRKLSPERFEQEIKRLFAGHDMEAKVTACSGSKFSSNLEKSLPDCDILIVAGGDGTARSAATRMLHTRKALGIIPCGTINLMARDLGIPLDLPGAVAALVSAQPVFMDTGEVNGEPFLCSALIGIFPEISPSRERVRNRSFLLYPAILWGALRALTKFPTLTAQIHTAKGDQPVQTKALAVSNNHLETRIGEPPFRPRLDEGFLEVYVSRHTRSRDLARLMIRLLLGTWKAEPGLESFQTHALNLTAAVPRLKINLDGEVHRMRTPLMFRLRPRSLCVLKPEPLH